MHFAKRSLGALAVTAVLLILGMSACENETAVNPQFETESVTSSVDVPDSPVSGIDKGNGWRENFESYTAGDWPSSWVPDGNATNTATNYIDDIVYSSETKSLRLFGLLGSCWGSLALRPIDLNPPYQIHLKVRNGDESLSGCHPDRATVQLRQGTNWWNPARRLMLFKGDGTIVSCNERVLGEYSTLEWYSVRILYEKVSAGEVKISYWINDVSKGSDICAAIPEEDQLTNLDLETQEGTVWIDDVKVIGVRNGNRKDKPLRDDYVAFYPFDGNADDESEYGHDGIVHGAALTADRFGNAASAYSFDGNDDWIFIEDAPEFHFTDKFAVSLWVKLRSSAPYYFPYHIIEKYGSWIMMQREWDILLGFTDAAGTNINIPWNNEGTTNLSPGIWYNFIMMYNGNASESNFKVFRNGELVYSADCPGLTVAQTNSNVVMSYYEPVPDAYGIGYYFDGDIDDVILYDRALSAREVNPIVTEGMASGESKISISDFR